MQLLAIITAFAVAMSVIMSLSLVMPCASNLFLQTIPGDITIFFHVSDPPPEIHSLEDRIEKL